MVGYRRIIIGSHNWKVQRILCFRHISGSRYANDVTDTPLNSFHFWAIFPLSAIFPLCSILREAVLWFSQDASQAFIPPFHSLQKKEESFLNSSNKNAEIKPPQPDLDHMLIPEAIMNSQEYTILRLARYGSCDSFWVGGKDMAIPILLSEYT